MSEIKKYQLLKQGQGLVKNIENALNKLIAKKKEFIKKSA